jgi:hypothetical protein
MNIRFRYFMRIYKTYNVQPSPRESLIVTPKSENTIPERFRVKLLAETTKTGKKNRIKI